MTSKVSALSAVLNTKTAIVGIIGLGYVELPLAIATNQKGMRVVVFDVSATKLGAHGEDHVAAADAMGGFTVTDDFSGLADTDVDEVFKA